MIGHYIKIIGCNLILLLIIVEIYLASNGVSPFVWSMIIFMTIISFGVFLFTVSPCRINIWFLERKERRVSKILEEEYKKKSEQIESFIEDYNSKRV